MRHSILEELLIALIQRRTLLKAGPIPLMPQSITALLHTSNAAPRLGRALETLLPCAEILTWTITPLMQPPASPANTGAHSGPP